MTLPGRCAPPTRVLLAGLLVVALAAPADATRACHLLKDETGDSGLLGGEGGGGPIPGTYESSLDIVSADIAADAKQLTVVIRVAELTTPEQPVPQGSSWSFHFASPEAAFFVDAGRTYDGDRFTLNHYLTPYSGDTSQSFAWEGVGPISGIVDTARSEVRMTAPLAMFKPFDHIGPGTTLTKLLVISWYEQGSAATETYTGTGEADETGGGGKASYTVGARNCVAVGR